MTVTYVGLAAIPVLLWAGLEAVAWKDRQRRSAQARARKRRGFVDMTPPPPAPFDQHLEAEQHGTIRTLGYTPALEPLEMGGLPLLEMPMEDIERIDPAWRFAAATEPERSRRSPWHAA